jgi:acetyl-CoA carboxylase biotin carboxylase subunit
MFKKILIANRGEIALRIIRTCREMGIATVAVYSEADRDSLHLRYADEEICIGKGPSQESYLNIPRIISAAEITDVEAIHPGYGFLAENVHFAEICESCRIKFIGPPPESLRLMGDKAQARKIMKKASVPILPGCDKIDNKDEAIKAANEIGYPVMIKACGGGGGRGIRIAHNQVSLVNALYTAQAEAESAFDNPQIYIEKYLEQSRHIEFQILADQYGNIIHLGERECTIQRKYQKLIEEAPSTALSNELRKKMGKIAVKAAKAVNYVNTGTVEFLVDQDMNYYFMEMNTRLQVEHPVTEMVYNIDMVKEQILAASGEKLNYKQSDIKSNGTSIECRINAEDFERNFKPSPGQITAYHPPGGLGIRIDSHIYDGYHIPPYYDSLISKLIVWGEKREQAIKRMYHALDEYVIEGIKTTIPFHKFLIANPAFLAGKIDSKFASQVLEDIKST